MTFECPKCKSPVAREGQRFCYRCGEELNAYYDSMKLAANPTESQALDRDAGGQQSQLPSSTVVLDPKAFETSKSPPPPSPPKARVKVLLATGDVFDRELSANETQIGKGPRNDIVIADPAVSTAHAAIRIHEGKFTLTDLGSRNGTYVNGERIEGTRPLNHGDVIAIGLSKLTLRLTDHSETAAVAKEDLARARGATPLPLTEDSLASAIVAAGLASKADVDSIRAETGGRGLYRALVDGRQLNEESLRDLMSRTFDIPVIDLKSAKLDEAVIAEFPARLAIEQQVFPVVKETNSIVLAVADPTDAIALDKVKRQTRSAVLPRLATAAQIREQIDRHYGPKLIGLLPSGDKVEHAIDQHEAEIGKAPHNHIVLNDPTVSNTHAILVARDGGYSLVDLGSTNGTFVNGERLGPRPQILKHGDKVQFGQCVFTFRNPAETAANATTALSAAALEGIRQRAGLQPTGRAEEAKPEAAQIQSPAIAAPTDGPAAQDGELAVNAGDTDETSDKKKKKKKKKKEKDARLRAAYVGALGRVFAAILSVALTVALTLYLTRSSSAPTEQVKISKKGHAKLKVPKAGSGSPIEGGMFEASGVVQVPGTDGVLFVDDAKLDEVLWMRVDQSGKQAGPVKAVPLGASIADMEGITYGDGYFYVTGSQGDPKDGDKNAIARFKFDTGSQTAKGIEIVPNFRDFLRSNVPELQAEGDNKAKEGGLNIEGLAWDLKRNRLLLGLRSPQMGGNAVIIPLVLKNPGAELSAENLRVADPSPIQLPLEGLGIRDIQYDSRLDSLLIIAGAPEHHDKKLGFKLWQWNGETMDASGLHALSDLDREMKPEGLTRFEFGGRDFIFIVGDAGSYVKLDYAGESE